MGLNVLFICPIIGAIFIGVQILAFLFPAFQAFLTLIYLIFRRQANRYAHPIAISPLDFPKALEGMTQPRKCQEIYRSFLVGIKIIISIYCLENIINNWITLWNKIFW